MDMPLDDFLTVLYVEVDDWYQEFGPAMLAGKPGVKPLLSDSEVLTLSLAQSMCGAPSEHEWVRFVHNNLKHLFPQMVCQSEYNRRVRSLFLLTEHLFKHLIGRLGVRVDPHRIVDSAPIHVRHWKRHGPGHLIVPDAELGYCAAKDMRFYGYRLMVLITPGGIPTDYELISANTDEREGAQDLLDPYRNLLVIGDKGFVSASWEEQLQRRQNITLKTPKRRNQKTQNTSQWSYLIRRFRIMVETTFSMLSELFNIEHPGARTKWGVQTRVSTRMTAFVMAAWLNSKAGKPLLDIASFSIV